MTEPAPASPNATTGSPASDGAVASPAGRLVPVVGLWGGGAALLAIAIAFNRGLEGSAAMGAVSVFAAGAAGLGLLAGLSDRAPAKWAFPVLGAQMVRTMLAPALGLAVYFLTPVEAVAFWLTLLAVAAAMLAGETIAVAKMFGSASPTPRGDGTTGREAVA
jgi:hypothetical protein